MPEWLNGAVSKTAIPISGSEVRILLSPSDLNKKRGQSHFFTSDGRKTLERSGVPLCGTEIRNLIKEIRRLRKWKIWVKSFFALYW